MLPPLATLEALSERLGIDLDVETPDGARAASALDDASALVRAESGREWLAENGDLEGVPDIIQSVTLAVAYRAFRNPDGTTQTSIGDVSVSFTREGVAGAIFLTKAEARAVRKAAGRSSLTSIVLESAQPLSAADPYYAPAQGDPIPLGPLPWRDA